jgi:hypothetical protein
MMIEPANGLVIRYNYLWAREFDRQEEAGRKARPTCVQIIVTRAASEIVVALFPITSQPPLSDRAALEIPETEGRRVGLRLPAWVIVDEWNLDNLAASLHIGDSRPLGRFSSAFMRRVRKAASASIRERRYRSIPRR